VRARPLINAQSSADRQRQPRTWPHTEHPVLLRACRSTEERPDPHL